MEIIMYMYILLLCEWLSHASLVILFGFSFYDIRWLFSVECELRPEKQLRIKHEIKHNTTRWQLNTSFAVEQRVNIIEIIHMTATWSICGTQYWYRNMNPRSASRKEDWNPLGHEVWWETVKYMDIKSCGLPRPDKKNWKFKTCTVYKFQNACQARTGRNMVKSRCPNAPITWLNFLCPVPTLKCQNPLFSFVRKRECTLQMYNVVYSTLFITLFNVGNVLLAGPSGRAV
jgi:hypothetical protein